jgi:hypothetical protein
MKTNTLIFILLFITYQGNAKIIRVPDDAKTIQTGINLAAALDTVLVQPGVYKESLNFIDKNIVVGSLYLVTGDTSFISQTVIEGDSINACVQFSRVIDTTAVLCGFTVTNGNGGVRCRDASPTLRELRVIDNHYIAPLHEDGLGGGIFLENSNAIIENTSISRNSEIGTGGCSSNWSFGGGIYAAGSHVKIRNVTIFENYLGESNVIGGRRGGGIYSDSSSLNLTNVTIYGHSADYGGGIYCTKSSINLENVTIKYNAAVFDGGGIYSDNSNLVFDARHRCNIYFNDSVDIGSDLYINGSEITDVYLDTFTVLQPSEYFASLLQNITFNILQAKVNQVHADLFVNPAGNNANSGLSPLDPFQTIRFALIKMHADSLNPHTIHLANGRYAPSTNIETFPLHIPDYVSLCGASRDGVVLDAEGRFGIGLYLNQNRGSSIENLIIFGLSETSEAFFSFTRTCGIYCNNSSPRLENLTIRNCSAGLFGRISGWGYGIYCENNSYPALLNSKIIQNYGAIHCRNNSNPLLMNVTISQNVEGIRCAENSSPILINTIIWSDKLQKITFDERAANSIILAYSDIQGGRDSILSYDNGTIHWLDGNIDANPRFVNPEQNDFRLQSNSPCIDVGIQDTVLIYNNDQDTLFIPPTTYFGAAPDLGYYEFDTDNSPTQIRTQLPVPVTGCLSHNYPNPFNQKTIINYQLPINSYQSSVVSYSSPDNIWVELSIYNMLGQEVATLVSEKQPAGNYAVEWDASEFSSGVYFYRFEAGTYSETRKLLLIK